MNTRTDGQALLAFAALGVTWSTAMPLSRWAGLGGVPPMVFPLAQACGAVLTLGLILLIRRKPISAEGLPLPLYLVSGIAGHGLPQIIVFLTVQNLPLGIVGLIIATNPLCTGALAAITGTQTLSRRKVAGIGLGFLGVMLIALPGVALPSADDLPWVALGLLVPLAFAVANTYSARLRPANSDSVRDAVGMMTVSAVLLFVANALIGEAYALDLGSLSRGDLALLVHALLAGLAFFLFFVVLERGGPIMVASASYIILVLSVIWGWLFFGEQPTPGYAVAAGLVMAGLTLTLTGSKGKA